MQPATADDRPNLLADIKRDHAAILGLHRRFQEELGLSAHEKQVLIWQLIHDLSVHSLAEEEVLYPEMAKLMGSRCRDHALSEHKSLKDLLSDLGAMSLSSPGFSDKLQLLMTALEHHIKEEEDEMLPEFASHVDRDQLADLAVRFQRAKHRVPTRPHPAAPDKPSTGNVILNTLTAPVDKMRDALRFHGEAGAPAGPPHGSS